MKILRIYPGHVCMLNSSILSRTEKYHLYIHRDVFLLVFILPEISLTDPL